MAISQRRSFHRYKPLTQQDPSVERVLSDRDDDVLADTLENLSARDHETVALGVLARLECLALFHALLVRELLDRVTFTCSARLVAADVVTAQENTVDGQNLSGLEQADVADNDILDVDDHFRAASNTLYRTVVPLLVELLELAFFLPVVDGTDQDDNGDSDTDGNTLNPVDLGGDTPSRRLTTLIVEDNVVRRTQILVETESERDDGDDGKQNLAVSDGKMVDARVNSPEPCP